MRHVVIGGFSVIANGYTRATNDSDLLVPDDAQANEAIERFLNSIEAVRLSDGRVLDRTDIADAPHLRFESRHGLIDIMRGGLPPLDFDTVDARAIAAELRGEPVKYASLPSIVGFKRLAGRPRDRNDLLELEAVRGPLPIEPIPGLDDQ